jgi:hypothetical protein
MIETADRKGIFDGEANHIVIAPQGLLSRVAKLYQRLTEDSRPNLVIEQTRARAHDYLRERAAEGTGEGI